MAQVFQEIGIVALGSRIRVLGEIITQDAEQIYKLYNIKMNPKWFPVFYVLSQNAESTITSISKAIGHSHVSVIKIVAEMKKAKLITESRNKTDKRSTLLSLSKLGQKYAEQIKDQYVDVRKALEDVSSQAEHNLWKALEEWDELFLRKSLLSRVLEKKKIRETKNVQIVEYDSRYKTAFRKLNEEWIKKYFKMEKPDRDALGDPENYILKRGGRIFVALLNDKPVGVCALLKKSDPHYPFELAKMGVAEKARGQNIGYLLGQAVINEARALKAKKLFLESNTILKPAIGLYKKLGFQKVQGPETPYARCNIQMELAL